MPLIAQWVRQRPWLAASIAGAAGGIAGVAGGIAAAASAASGSPWAAYRLEGGILNIHYAVEFYSLLTSTQDCVTGNCNRL